MSTVLIDRVNTHNIHVTLSGLFSTIERAESAENIDDYVKTCFDRAKQVCAHTESVINSTDPYMIPINILDNLNQNIANISANISNYLPNRHMTQYVDNINNHVNNVLTFTAQLIQPTKVDDIEAIRDAITSFRKSMGLHISNAEKQVTSFNEKLSLAEDQLAKNNEILEKQSRELSAFFDNSEQKNDKNMSELVNCFEELNRDFLVDQNSRKESFQASEEKRTEEFHVLVEKLKSDFAEELVAKMNAAQKVIDEAKNELNNILIYINDKKSEVEKQVGAFAVTTMSGMYQKTANRERKTVYVWQAISLAAFATLIVFAYHLVQAIQTNSSFSWTFLVSRIVLTGTVASAVAFAVRQVSLHQKAERHNRQYELELSSLNPYLTGLDAATSTEIKKTLADRMFGRAEATVVKEEDNKGITGGIDLTKVDLSRLDISKLADLIKPFLEKK